MKKLITPSRWFEPNKFSAIRHISSLSGIIAAFALTKWHWMDWLGDFDYILFLLFFIGPMVAVDILETDVRKETNENENHISHLQAKIDQMEYKNPVSTLQKELDELKGKESSYKDEIKRLKKRVNHLLRA